MRSAPDAADLARRPRRRRGRRAATVATVLTLVAASAPIRPVDAQRADGEATGAPRDTPSLVIVGDSVANTSRAQLRDALGGWDVTIDAENGRPTAVGISRVRARGAALGDRLVVELGYNDGGSGPAFADRVRRLLDVARDVEFVWWVTMRDVPGTSYAAMNQVIRAEADRRPNVRTIEWGPASDPHSDHTVDGIHLTSSGKEAMARLIADEVAVSLDPSATCETPRPAPPASGAARRSDPTTHDAGTGYWIVDSDGVSHGFGSAAGRPPPPEPDTAALGIVALRGPALVRAEQMGRVSTTGTAPHLGDARHLSRTGDVVAVDVHPTGLGYWLATAGGQVFRFGRAAHHGSVAGFGLCWPPRVVDLAATPGGYVVLTAAGRLHAFGAADHHGDLGAALTAEPPGRTAVRVVVDD